MCEVNVQPKNLTELYSVQTGDYITNIYIIVIIHRHDYIIY